MTDYLPIVGVFVIGFVAYLGKLGVTGALARQRKLALEKLKLEIIGKNPVGLMMNVSEYRKDPKCETCDHETISEQVRKELRKYKKPVESTMSLRGVICITCDHILTDDTLEQRSSVPGSWEKCVNCRTTEHLESIKEIPEDEEALVPVRPKSPVEENIFQATEEDLAWYIKLLQERYKLKDRKVTSLPKFFNPEDGVTHTIRILPSFISPQIPNCAPHHQSKLFSVVRQHYIDPKDGKMIQCGRKRGENGHWNGQCPICEHFEYLKRKSPAVSVRYASKFEPNERFYYNVVQVGEGEHFPMIWSVSRHTHEKIEQEIVNSGDDISSLMTGRNFKVLRTDVNRYCSVGQVEFDKEPSMMNREDIQNWIANLWNLEEYAKSQTKLEAELQSTVRVKKPHQTTELEVAACPSNVFRQCQYCKKSYRVTPYKDHHFCSVKCRNLAADGDILERSFCKSGSLSVGDWVHWKTQAGSISVRPSIVYGTRVITKNGEHEQSVMLKNKKNKKWSHFHEQSVMLKYKKNKKWSHFWVRTTKCQLLSSFGRPTGTIDDAYIEKMFVDYTTGKMDSEEMSEIESID